MIASKHERGIALVIVLWVGMLVIAISAAFIADTRSSTQMTRNFLDNAEARAMADGGVHLALFELLDPDPETPWKRDGQLYRHGVPGGALAIAVESEAGKIDINNANDKLLEGLFVAAGVGGEKASALIQAIGNFRTGEESRNRLLRDLDQPEEEIVTEAQRMLRQARRNRESTGNQTTSGSRGKSRAFHSIDTLGQVPGISADLHARLRPALTVFGGRGVDFLTAPREVLLAIPGVSDQAVDNFLTGRAGDDAENSLETFLSVGSAREHWEEGDESKIVTVKVLAQSDNGASFIRIAVVELSERSEPPFVVKEWREGDTSWVRPDQFAQPDEENQEGGES
jgi:general secretion pathway protein K